MKAYFAVVKSPAGVLLLLLALALLLGQTAAFLLTLRENRSGNRRLAAALHLLLGFLLFVLILESYDLVKYPEPKITRRAIPFLSLIQAVPWLVYALLEVLSAGILALWYRAYQRYRRTHVTPDAIRQTVDLLPEGLCISAADGTVLLANLKMTALCRELTGEVPRDPAQLWNCLEKRGVDQGGKRLIRTRDGEVWLFERGKLRAEGRDCDRTSAVKVTERYRITEELRENNAHLRDVQRRMKEAVELSGEMFVRQEEANARAALHNQLGQVLLMDRHWLEHPESADGAMVALTTRQMNRFLLGETLSPEPERVDPLGQAVYLAKSIGVSVELRGRTPTETGALDLLARAVRECAANAVKHAEGDRLFVEIECREEHCSSADKQATRSDDVTGADKQCLSLQRYTIVITNNGRPPKGPIAESGGLLALRRAVEAEGGRMTVESEPRFALTLEL